jgi:UDP-hydrolysing UDP-N-acetyl-D-glucosamine 2-epimerase
MCAKRKVCVVVASRANYGRIKATMRAIQDHPDLELQLVVGASALLQRYGKAVELIEKDGFKVDSKVFMVIEGESPTTMAKSTGLAIIELATIFENLAPDIVLTVADRYETLSTAVAASYMNIPLAHTQGGEVTGSIDESVRHAITKLAHIHFPTTELSKKRLVQMGENTDAIHTVGCPSIDAICSLELNMTSQFMDTYTKKGVGSKIDFTKPYIVVLQHPVTTEFGHGADQIQETLEAVYPLGIQTVWLWPNIDAGSDDISKAIRTFRERHNPEHMHFYINFPVEDYAVLLNNAACIVGNSSSGIREGSYLGVPAVNIGSRQSNRERGANLMDVDYDREEIKEAILNQLDHGSYPQNTLYGDGNASTRIAEVLGSHIFNIQKVFRDIE